MLLSIGSENVDVSNGLWISQTPKRTQGISKPCKATDLTEITAASHVTGNI